MRRKNTTEVLTVARHDTQYSNFPFFLSFFLPSLPSMKGNVPRLGRAPSYYSNDFTYCTRKLRHCVNTSFISQPRPNHNLSRTLRKGRLLLVSPSQTQPMPHKPNKSQESCGILTTSFSPLTLAPRSMSSPLRIPSHPPLSSLTGCGTTRPSSISACISAAASTPSL